MSMMKKDQRSSGGSRITAVLSIVAVLAVFVLIGWWIVRGTGMDTLNWIYDTITEAVRSGDKADASTFQIDANELPWNLQLVNRYNPLEHDVEIELTVLANEQQVDSRMYPELQRMFDDARATGVYPVVAAGYRTHEKQQSLMDERISEFMEAGCTEEEAIEKAKEWVAEPGTSEHELGLAVDINADGVNSYGYEVYEWLDQHAYEYGFIQRYAEDKVSITGISNEDWHYRYVGMEAAAEMHETGECLEEYLMRHYGQKTE